MRSGAPSATAAGSPRGATLLSAVVLLLALGLAGRAGAGDPEEIRFLKAVLETPSVPADARRQAVLKLLELQSDAAIGAICDLWSVPQGAARVELEQSLAGASGRLPRLVEAIAEAWSGELGDRSCLAGLVASMEPRAAATHLVVVATSDRFGEATRIGAARLLASLPGLGGVEGLIALLAAEAAAPESVRLVVREALSRARGADLGPDAEPWRRWWSERRADADAPACEERIEALVERIDQADEERRRLAERLEQTWQRLRGVQVRILAGLDLPAAQEHLQTLLQDDLELLRLFALQEFERILRDGDRISDETARLVRSRLDDAVPLVRTEAARLLVRMEDPELPQLAAARLLDEGDPATLAVLLRALGDRPVRGTFGAILSRLLDPALTERSARAVLALEGRGWAPEGWQNEVLEQVRPWIAAGGQVGPELLELWAAVDLADADRAALDGMLRTAEAPLRARVASGWARRGLLDRLEPLAGDAQIHAVLVRAIAQQRRDLEGLRMVLRLPSPANGAADLRSPLMRLVEPLSVADLLVAERLLAESALSSPQWRIEMLRRALAAEVAATDPSERAQLLRRVAELLLSIDRPGEAADQLAGEALLADSVLVDLLFKSRLLAGRYEPAAAQRPEPGAWLAVLEQFDLGSPAVAPLGAEIDRRFSDLLTSEQRRLLDEIRGVSAAPQAPSAGVDGPAVEPTPSA